MNCVLTLQIDEFGWQFTTVHYHPDPCKLAVYLRDIVKVDVLPCRPLFCDLMMGLMNDSLVCSILALFPVFVWHLLANWELLPPAGGVDGLSAALQPQVLILG